jgi:glycosidase
MQHWVVNAGIDGFRCDYADGPPIQFWRSAIASVRSEAKRDLFFLAESGTRELHAAGFDCISGFDFYNTLMQVHREGRSVKDLAAVGIKDRQNVADPKREARYTSNHDLLGTDGPAIQALGGEKGALVAFLVACTQGPPIIYGSQEGLPEKSEGVYPADYTSGHINPDYKKLLAARKSSNALRRGRPTSYGNDDVYVVRMDHETERVLVVCNLRNRKVTYSVPDFLSAVSWVDIFSKEKKPLGRTIELEPFGYLMLQVGRD